MIFTAPPQPPRTIDQSFATFLDELRRHVAAHLGMRVPAPLAGLLVGLIVSRLGRIGLAFATIAARVRAGRLRGCYRPRAVASVPAPSPAAKAPPPPKPLLGLPRRVRWLIGLVPMVGAFTGQLAALLAEPAMAPLLAAPGMTRVLRPLCRMLGVIDPELIRRQHAVVTSDPGHETGVTEAAPAPRAVRATDLCVTWTPGKQRPTAHRGALFQERRAKFSG